MAFIGQWLIVRVHAAAGARPKVQTLCNPDRKPRRVYQMEVSAGLPDLRSPAYKVVLTFKKD
jgi:hypothetical protein